jgi:hypothetical protein
MTPAAAPAGTSGWPRAVVRLMRAPCFVVHGTPPLLTHFTPPLPPPLPQVIAQYILDAYRTTGPALTASTPEGRAVAALVSRLHDQYVTPIQVGAVGHKLVERWRRAGGAMQRWEVYTDSVPTVDQRCSVKHAKWVKHSA